MSRQTRRQWASQRRSACAPNILNRPLRFEALEDRRLLAITVNTLLDVNNANDSFITLREAIATAPSGETIKFSVTGTINLSLPLGPLFIDKNLTINGPGGDLLTIKAYDPTPANKDGDGSRVFYIDDLNTSTLAHVEINGLTLTGGDSSQVGGAILTRENLTLRRSVISGNATTVSTFAAGGGGIYSSAGPGVPNSLSVFDSEISNNAAALSEGGGIRARYGSLVVERSAIVDNVALIGGGISAADGSLSVQILDSTISRNRSTGSFGGGGLFSAGASATIINSTFDQNSASVGGGGILSWTTLQIERSTISRNQAVDGGGIASTAATSVIDSTISGNVATYGGGISHNPSGSLTIAGSTISGNTAVQGGGLLTETSSVNGGSQTQIVNSTISDNTATGVGGGVFNGIGWTFIRNSTITDNSAPANSGGGVASRVSNTLTFVFSTIVSGNASGGDVQYVDGSSNPFGSGGYNLIGNGNAATGSLNQFFQVGDRTAVTNPMIGPLADNGGRTLTHALLSGSLAIDAGDVNNPPPSSYDQRRAPMLRVADGDGVNGARIDIGAYERQTVSGLNLVVDLLLDEVDGDYSAGDFSLREAIGLANGSVGPDTITFVVALSGTTITLGGTELAITEELTIDARPLAANVTVDANQLSRIFSITVTTADVTLAGLTLTGGRTTGSTTFGGDPFSGGAIRFGTNGNLTLNQSTVSGNSTAGNGANGGGIFAIGHVTLIESTVSGNSTMGSDAFGGGILAGGVNGHVTLIQSTVSGNSTAGSGNRAGGVFANLTVTLAQSTVSGNSTAGTSAVGGGIFANQTVTLTQSTVRGNNTAGDLAVGGGISAVAVMLTQSTVSGNSTAGSIAHGGGILASTVTLTQSTVSGNSTAGNGAQAGGIRASAGTLIQSTVTDNHAMHVMSTGGGVFQSDSSSNSPFSISGSIVAGNTAGGGGADLVKDPQSTLIVNYSAIGVIDGLPIFTGNVGNLTGTASFPFNPQLGPLSHNGGPTMTHALLAGSPAINAGDPSFVAPPNYDQRGFAFARVVGGRIDMGAFELQPLADFDSDSDMDGFDFLAWQRGFGATGAAATRANGNADGDGDVDDGDLAVWRSQFGLTAGVNAASAASSEALLVGDAPAVAERMAADAVFASSDFAGLIVGLQDNGPVVRRRLRRR